MADAHFSRDGTPRDEQASEILRDYQDWVYKEALTDDFEETRVANDTFSELINDAREELFDHVTARRNKALPAAIETFNMIQGKKLPNLNGDLKLNLYRNPDTPKKEWII